MNKSRQLLLIWRRSRQFQRFISLSARYRADEGANVNPKAPQELAPTKQEIAEIAKKIPMEKQSIVCGFVDNKFEKDFIIYPEYENLKDVEKIKEFVTNLGHELDKALSQSDDPTGIMPYKVREVLLNQGIFASTVPKEYSGLSMNLKDKLQVAECLGGHDLSTFTSYNHLLMASNLITQYGTPEQRRRYLPGIAVGKWRPTICWQEETSSVTKMEQVIHPPGQNERICSVKVNVADAIEANLFIVFVNRLVGDIIRPTCYIIEKDSLANDQISSIQVKNRIRTSGLQNCNFSTVVFDNVPVSDSLRLGEVESNEFLMEEISFAGKSLYGAAVVGFLKKVLGELCTFANMEIKGNLRLSDSHPVQKEIFQLGLLTYVVESMAYYIGGLSDEQLFLTQDIENSVVQRYANRALRQAVTTITEVAGICASDTELPYDKMIKDTIALMSLSDPDMHLIRRISIPAIEYCCNHAGGMKTFMRTGSIRNFLSGRNDLEGHLHPKLMHFIAEHVHPSLMRAAQEFEYSISRLGKVIECEVKLHGIYINTDLVALQSITTLIENNLAMIASLARASRSYSIGVRNSDLEIKWTECFCLNAGAESKRIVLESMEKGKTNFYWDHPNQMAGANLMFDANGYCLESPIEKSW